MPDEPFSPPTPRTRLYRLILLIIVTLAAFALLVALGTVKPLFPVSENSSDTLILYALTSVNFIAALVLLTVLMRNLLKLRRERVERRLGSKFKTRMVMFSIGIALLPGILLFFFAYGLLNTTLDLWFSSRTGRFFASARNMQQVLLQNELDELAQISRTITRAAGLRGPDADLMIDDEEKAFLERAYTNQELCFLQILARKQPIFEKHLENIDTLEALTEARVVVANGQGFSRWIWGKDLRTIYLVVGQPISQASELVGGVLLVRKLPQNLADSFADLAKQNEAREKLSRNAKQIKITNLYLLGAMTLLIIFAATWIALYVARGITVPIQALAEATQAIARGNFDIRVLCPAEDELAALVASFNQMADQLSENRHTLDLAAVEQRQTNRALEERRLYIETILQSLSTGIISLDNEHRLITINGAALTILRCATTPVAGTSVDEIFSLDSRVEILRLVKRARRVGQLHAEFELYYQEVPIHTSVTITPLRDSKGIFTGSVLMIEDISDMIKAQRSAVWSEVARRMAHEIKNPLTPIQLSAERIAKNSQKVAQTLDSRYYQIVDECTTTIKQEVGTLQRMVDEFSQFARLPHAQLTSAKLNEVVQETLKLYTDRLENTQIETSLADDLPPINLDREQIKRVLVNLIENAIEAMADITAARLIKITTEYWPEKELGRLIVSDTGHGITPEDRDKLFQPYFSTRKRGTGLGLAIVSHIINDHAGRIEIAENQPQGAKFIIDLPVIGNRND